MENLFTRQIILPEVGVAGQKKLSSAKILIVGAGGLGCPAMLYLAAAGIGKIGVIDSDRVQQTNLHRQVLYTKEDLEQQKSQIAKAKIMAAYPSTNVIAYDSELNVNNATQIISEFDLVLDCTDNFAAKYLINDACVVLNKAFIIASIFSFEGQLSLYNAKLTDGSFSGTYRCLFPEAPSIVDVPSCAEHGVIGVVPGFFGVLQSTEAIKYILGIKPNLANTLLVYNLITNSQQKLCYRREPVTVKAVRLQSQMEYNKYMNPCKSFKVINPKELKEKFNNNENFILIDVREEFEREICNIGGELIPLKTFLSKAKSFPRDKDIIVYCKSGGRSAKACDVLIENFGYERVFNLDGGILRYSDEVDNTLRTY